MIVVEAFRSTPRSLWGLRTRLLLAFITVIIVGAVAVTWVSTAWASAALVSTFEEQAVTTTTGQVERVSPSLNHPPDPATLDRLRTAVGPGAVVTYEGQQVGETADVALITADLREQVATQHRTQTQRVVVDQQPRLLIGMPIMVTTPSGEQTPSRIEVYVVRDLAPVQARIDELARSVIVTAAIMVVPAVLLALFAARSVLRPVRELRDTAERLATGDLAARAIPLGRDELAELTLSVNRMAQSLQRSMSTMAEMQADARRFAADVSHELRTPVSTLTAVAEVLHDTADELPVGAREPVELAVTEIHRLVQLVEDLVEVSRFDAGTAALRLEDVDAVEVLERSLRARGWTDRVEVSSPSALPWRLDPRRLDVIIANLVSNAMRYGDPPIRLQLIASDDALELAVTDEGSGISVEMIPRVFDRFAKADNTRGHSAGSGLGLAIAAANARLHDGKLTAGNTVRGGAEFTLQLPPGRESSK